MKELALRNVKKSFGSVEVLRDLSLSFQAGTVTAIVGDNGAGKSTLLKTIAGIYRPDSGSVHLNGTTLSGLSAAAHRACGIEMVYQDLALAGQQSVVTNLFIGREITHSFGFLDRKSMKSRAAEILKRLSIHIPHLEASVGTLSGGQRQAIAIARAVLFDPQILLLDEPTAALAAREVDQVLALIRQERAQGRTVILISHRLNDVFAVADRIVVMKQGRIVADDAAASTTLSQVIERIVG